MKRIETLTSFKRVLLLIAATGFLTIILTWPLTLRIFDFYPDFGRFGDYTFSGAMLSYNHNALITGKLFNHKEYFNGFMFYPQSNTLAYSDYMLVPSFVFSIFYLLTHNHIFSTNVTTLFVFIATFISAFYVFRFFTKESIGSFMGALIFTFNPLTFAQFPQHFDLLNKCFLIQVFFFGFLFFSKPTLKRSFFLWLFFTLNIVSVTYYGIFTILFLPLLWIPFMVQNLLKNNTTYFLNFAKNSFILLIFLPILLYFNTPYLTLAKTEYMQRSITENAFYSARIIDFIASSPNNFLYGNFVKSLDSLREYKNNASGFLSFEERSLFLNITPMVLFGFGLYSLYKKRRTAPFKKTLNHLIYFSIICIVSFIFMWGPFLQGWNGKDGTIKLPFYYLYEWLFIIKGTRVPTRFEFLFYIPFSLIAAYGFGFIVEKWKKYTVFLAFFILFLLVLENFTINSFSEKSTVIAKFEDLNQKNELAFLAHKKTLHLPIFMPDVSKDTMYLTWAVLAKEHMINGNTAYFPTEQVELMASFKEKIDEEALKKLDALHVDYILFHADLMTKNEDLKLRTHKKLYDRAVIYNKNGVMIIDIKKYSFNLKLCDFTKDMSMEIFQATDSSILSPFYAMHLTNKSDCYLPSIYSAKYKEIEFLTKTKKHTARIKLPAVILPFQTLLLAEPKNNLKID